MNLPVISLLALAVAVTLSCTTKINVGILGMVFAWVIGVYLAGRPFSEIAAGFPTGLFLTLVGVTLLFTQAKVNGTLDKSRTSRRAIVPRQPAAHPGHVLFSGLHIRLYRSGQHRVGGINRTDGDDRCGPDGHTNT